VPKLVGEFCLIDLNPGYSFIPMTGFQRISKAVGSALATLMIFQMFFEVYLVRWCHRMAVVYFAT
jgi:hypothetical protein